MIDITITIEFHAGAPSLEGLSYNLARQMPPAECLALANALRGLSRRSFATKEELVKATQVATKDALGTRLAAWKPILDRFAKALNENTYASLANGLFAASKR